MKEGVHVHNQIPHCKLSPESAEQESQDKAVTIRSKKEKAAYNRIVFLNSHSLKILAFIIFIWNLLIQVKLGMLGTSHSSMPGGSIKYLAREGFNFSVNLFFFFLF